MRILHATETVLGGVGTHLNLVVPWQIDHLPAVECRVLAPAHELAELRGIPEACRVGYVKTGRDPLSLFRFAQAFRRCLFEFRPEIIHLHSSIAGALGRTLARACHDGGRVVYTPHGWSFFMEGTGVQKRFFGYLEARLSAWCERIVCVSRHEMEAARAVGVRRSTLRLIHNGVGAPLPAPQRDDRDGPLTLLYVGRLARAKGFDVLLKAMQALGDSGCRLKVAGIAPDDLPTLEIPRAVELLGWRTPGALAKLYAESDAVIMPSRWEGFSYVALEAMASGTPVIASDLPSFRELITPGETGVLFEKGDVQALMRALSGLRRSELRRMGNSARLRVLADYRVERANALLNDEYAALLHAI